MASTRRFEVTLFADITWTSLELDGSEIVVCKAALLFCTLNVFPCSLTGKREAAEKKKPFPGWISVD